MKTSQCKNYDDLPLFLNANLLSQVLGVSISTAYEETELAQARSHQKLFPVAQRDLFSGPASRSRRSLWISPPTGKPRDLPVPG